MVLIGVRLGGVRHFSQGFKREVDMLDMLKRLSRQYRYTRVGAGRRQKKADTTNVRKGARLIRLRENIHQLAR